MITKYARPNIVQFLLTLTFLMGKQSIYNGAVSVSHPFAQTKTADRLVVYNSEQIMCQLPDQLHEILLTLC